MLHKLFRQCGYKLLWRNLYITAIFLHFTFLQLQQLPFSFGTHAGYYYFNFREQVQQC